MNFLKSLILKVFTISKYAKFLAVLAFWPLVFSNFASASDDFIYLAGPPKGHTKLELTTSPKKNEFQIVGSLSPMSLLINGEVIKPKMGIESNQKLLIIGEQNKRITGSTFFHNYILKKNTDFINIEIHDGKNTYTHKIITSNKFLDFPITKVKVIKNTIKEKYDFNLSGKYSSSKSNVVVFKDADVKIMDDRISIRKGFNLGNSYLSGHWGVKVINLPVKITKEDFSEDKVQINLLKKDFLNFARANGFIEGQINFPEKVKLFISNKEVQINNSGEFEIEFFPAQKETTLNIKANYQEKGIDKNISYDLKIIVPTFDDGNPWYYPEVQKEKYYFDINLIETYTLWHTDLKIKDTQDKFKLEVDIGKKISPLQTVGLRFIKREPYSMYNGSESIEYKEDLTLGVNTKYYENWGWFYGAGVSIHRLRSRKAGHECNFCENIENLGAIATTSWGHRFSLRESLELLTYIELNLPITKMPYSHLFKFKFINFRMKY